MWKAWIIAHIAKLFPKLAESLAKRVFSHEAAVRARQRDRARWHRWREHCKITQTELDNILADYIGTRCKFRTPPGEQSLEQRAQETLGWSFVHLTRLRVAVDNQPMTPEQIDTAVKAIHECTDVVKATLAMLNDRAAAQMTP